MNQLEYYKSKPEDFLVKKHSEKDLYIVKYLHSGIDWSQPYALDARGIVLDGNSNVVSRPYKKFFNYNELKHRDDLPREIKRLSYWNSDEFTVMEKLDGSLTVVSQYEGEIIYSSSGNIEGEYPDLFKKWFENNLNQEQMEKLKDITTNYTVILEYVSPQTRIVVPYQEESMILHGVINTETGKEIEKIRILMAIANGIGVDVAHFFDISFDQIMNIQKREFTDDIMEGFVVKFKDGKRLKIKTEEYVKRHFDYTIAFGRIDTKRKIKLFLDKIQDDTIDDIIAILEEKGDVTSINFVNKLRELNETFDKMVKEGYNIVNQEGFNKKDYVLSHGTKGTMNNIVLNSEKEHYLDKLREDYIKSELEKDDK